MQNISTNEQGRAEHGQVTVKVNARVDEQIAPLVAALNEFELLTTIDSCQGSEVDAAYVYFTRPGTSRELLGFVDDLAAALNARLNARENEYEIRAEWRAGGEKPMAVLRTRPGCIEAMACALSAIAKAHQTKRSPCDG